VARLRANIDALKTLRSLEREGRPARPEERARLARWSGWGALAAVFDEGAAGYERAGWARGELMSLMSAEEFAAARLSTLNAHYTDAAYTEAIWDAVKSLGFRGGSVLEPGCGSGNFVGIAPDGARMVGVELDPVTAGMARALYPEADIRCESFAETRAPEGAFDAAVGNVPFGDITLHDPRHNPSGHRIHNHFLVKSLCLTRPGGIVALVSSRYTLDSANPAARREMAEVGDLLGAVRLPTGAHRRAAGTDVVTDVLLFRRRAEGEPSQGQSFEASARLEGDLRINEYFRVYPEHVLGTMSVGQGEGGRPELVVDGLRDAGAQLREALADIVRRAQERGLTFTEREGPELASAPVAMLRPEERHPDGYLAAGEGASFTEVREGVRVPFAPPASQAEELRALLGLRDTVMQLLDLEAGSVDDSAELDGVRADLNRCYDLYVARHGPINRFSERRTGRVDPESGEERYARIRPRRGGFDQDPYCKVVDALEHFDASTQSASKASIFQGRVLSRRVQRLGADTAEDALAICLDTHGDVRLGEIAKLLGVEEVEARQMLGTLVFDVPGSDELVTAAAYLSGNVRVKLADARAWAREEGSFDANVKALEGALPRDLRPDEIHAKLGAPWIEPQDVQAFLCELLDDPHVVVESPGGGVWAVRSRSIPTTLSKQTWGVTTCSALDITQALLEQRQLRVYDTVAGEQQFNAEATAEAVEKARELSERFSEWVWEDPARATRLARVYNDRFNAIVPRSYDGVALSLPGLSTAFRPRPHQYAAVARVIHEPAVGLFHEVGAGKTAEMVISAMELRRLGLASKPVVVVPNHMLEQFSREWLQLYPRARLLAASKDDLGRDHRRLFVAKCATGDWDAVVMTRSAFERIPMSQEAQKQYLAREVGSLAGLIVEAKAQGGARLTLKRLEGMKKRAEERLKSKLDGAKDPGISFEQLGIDYVFVDEAHAYKNLRTASNIPGMSVDGSQRATDLHMKLEYLRERGPRVATLATATPIANSMGEAYTMQRYLRPDLLERSGITGFDQWAAVFGETTSSIEVSPDGSGMRQATRFAKFRNVPELLLQWQVSADIKTAEDLKLPTPPLKVRESDGGRLPETVVVLPSEALREFMVELAHRAEKVRSRQVEAKEDNMLSVASDGRAAGLDLRLVGLAAEQPQKVSVAADRIANIYEAHRDTVYPGMDGAPHPVPGALQLVFADLGTPKPGEWSVYEQLRTELVARGVPRGKVRFMHEASTDREKGELFAACRDGRVAVLLGSTERMGVGTNVQLRAVALHHLDCPWRPADIAQREGRIIRQGNANPEVQILRYVTESSFDAYLWQTVSRKSQFIGQVMRGRLDVREIEDIGEVQLSYNEVKALATGNPLLLEQAKAQAEVTRLERLQRAHQRNQASIGSTLVHIEARIQDCRRTAKECESAHMVYAARKDASSFAMTIGAGTFDKKSAANDAIVHRLRVAPSGSIGVLHGFELVADGRDQRYASVILRGVPNGRLAIEVESLGTADVLRRCENLLERLPTEAQKAQEEAERLTADIARAKAERGQPFKHAEALLHERSRLLDMEVAIALSVEPMAPRDATKETLGQPSAEDAEHGDSGLEEGVELAIEGAEAAAQEALVATSEAERTAPEKTANERPRVEELAARWRGLYAAELERVLGRAASLEHRLAERAGRVRSAMDEHEKQRPRPSPIYGVLPKNRAQFEAQKAAWEQGHAALKARLDLVETRRCRVAEYLREPRGNVRGTASVLALCNVKTQEPELAAQIALIRRGSALGRSAVELRSRSDLNRGR
jgi:N12 class adenine-specific DNA methylase